MREKEFLKSVINNRKSVVYIWYWLLVGLFTQSSLLDVYICPLYIIWEVIFSNALGS